ncbi:hypothetical protein SASPL_122883 [Salvia splendens]|uniref:Uncharacterized protein n=1 Tax=Salvia splendens TaxID=180675 RepID=A0A8X8ZRL1_SALSN|nr:uncharacterized protein LOC121743649 [Salvia splendens]KAG6415472.1 hypothetical protein SASPL_122883 [Salvia splendens]
MGSFRGLGIGLSLVFGFILMGLFAVLCYLLWWKKRTVYSRSAKIENLEKFSFPLCWKNSDSVGGSSRELTNSIRSQFEQEDVEAGLSKSESEAKGYGEEGVESELMRLHNLCGPPRFLFTIKEESREDLESEDGKSRISNSMSFGIGSPIPSPAFRTSNLAMTEAEVNRLRSSPPPTFKFLKDAEDKFMRKQEAERRRWSQEKEVDDVPFVKLSKAAAQVMPLPSSPTINP